MTTDVLLGRLRRAAVIVAVVTMCPAAAFAQRATPAPDRGDLRPGEIQRLFDAYLVMEAQQALGLSDTQYPAFLTRLRSLQETRRRHLAARATLLAELSRLTAPKAAAAADEGTIRERLTALEELDTRNGAETRQAYAALDALLDVRQQARFRVFENQVERRKLELMLRARQNAGPRAPRRR